MKYIDVINREKPEYIRGYTRSIYDICKFARDHEIIIHSPRMVSPTSEVLTYEMRDVIETVLNTRVFNFYGSREVHNLAGECNCGNLHMFSFLNFIEIVDDDNRDVSEGESGRIIVTPLRNYAMPLIRYEIGDIGTVGVKSCRCGSPLPTLTTITGRTYCNFHLKDGSIVRSGAFTGLFYYLPWIKQFQIIQEDYDVIRILVVNNGQIVEKEKTEVERKIRRIMGDECQIIWEFLDEILPTKSGKFLFTISKIEIP